MAFDINVLKDDFKYIAKKLGFTLDYFIFSDSIEQEEYLEATFKDKNISFAVRVENPDIISAGEIEFVSDEFAFVTSDDCFEILSKEFQKADKFIKYLSKEFNLEDYRLEFEE